MVIDTSIWGSPENWNYYDQSRYHDIRLPSLVMGEYNYKTLYRLVDNDILDENEPIDTTVCVSGMGAECPYSNITYVTVDNDEIKTDTQERNLTNWVFYNCDGFGVYTGRYRTTCLYKNNANSNYRNFSNILSEYWNGNSEITLFTDFNYKKLVLYIRVVASETETSTPYVFSLDNYITTEYTNYPYVRYVCARLYYEQSTNPTRRTYIHSGTIEGYHFATTAILDDYETTLTIPNTNRTYCNHISETRGNSIPVLGLSFYSTANTLPPDDAGMVYITYGIDDTWTINKDSSNNLIICYHVTDIDIFKEKALRAAAAFGCYFTGDSTTAESGSLTDSKMYIGVLDSRGIAHGRYLQGEDTLRAVQNTWEMARNNTYDPTPIPVQEPHILQEYYNVYSKEYISTLKKKNIKYLFKLELLSDNETSVGEIVKDLENVDGQININYEQITRRSCSLTITDVKRKYLPNRNSSFWYNRKFKIWIGVVVKGDIYWWSQGVYYTRSANSEHRNLRIEGVDKGGYLDGTLKTAMTSGQYVIPAKNKLTNIIKELLSLRLGATDITAYTRLCMGADKIIDCVPPCIDTLYHGQIVQSELSIDNNSYIGDLFIKLAELYSAEAYYDINGHFVFEPYKMNSGYTYSPTQWRFEDLSSTFENANYTTSFEGENTVCVYTNASNAGVRNVSYTAYNTNPLSPVNIGIGIRRAVDQEIEYYDVSEEQMIKDCRSAANYYLKRNSMMGVQLSFSCPIIPHLDVNKTIEISDKYHNIEDGIFVIQSITIPLNANAMEISASNINWLPNDMDYSGISEILEGEGEG